VSRVRRRPDDDWEPTPIVQTGDQKRMAISVLCEICGRYYRPFNIRQSYCSRACAGRAHTLAARRKGAALLRAYDERKSRAELARVLQEVENDEH
jgi:hypothetical protein